MRVLLPLRKHANKHEDDEDDYLVLVDSDSEDGPQYIVHSLPEAAAALADPSRLTNQVFFQARKQLAAFENEEEGLLATEGENTLREAPQNKETEQTKHEYRDRSNFKAVDSSIGTLVARLEVSQQSRRTQTLLQEELNHSEVPQKSFPSPKQASYKTTGLNTEETSISSPSLVSRKRKAHSTWNEGQKWVTPNQEASLLAETGSLLDQKPAARKVSKALTVPASDQKTISGLGKMVSGGSSRRVHQQWRYYHHPGDDLRQEAEDPLESPEMVGAQAENNPESARGDVRLEASMPSYHTSSAAMNAIALYPPAAPAISSAAPSDVAIRGAHLASGGKIPSSTFRDSNFSDVLKKRGLEIREQDGDGNCLFRAVSLQIYGDPAMHGDIRKQCMDFMERDQEHFSQFVIDEVFPQYVARKRQDGVHGNNPEIQAISELFNRPVEVFTPEKGATPLNIFHAEYKTGDAPIRLSYHDGNHYNAVVDPLVPTAGLGLGLPGLQPGLADKLQMAKAVAESDAAADQMELDRAIKTSFDDEYHRAIKESKLSAEHASSNAALSLSDMDATYFELEQAALERSLESYKQQEHDKKKRASTPESRGKNDDENDASNESSKVQSSISTVGATAMMEPAKYVASVPCPNEASIPVAAAAAASASIAASAAAARSDSPVRLRPVDEYPSTVQELVMNGFSLSAVVKAFELVGNNFDDMLALLMANSSC